MGSATDAALPASVGGGGREMWRGDHVGDQSIVSGSKDG